MNSVAGLPTAERVILFQETAQRRGLAPLIIEKDFWVCWTLRQFFDLSGVGEHLIFKGGTSLSKIFGVIERLPSSKASLKSALRIEKNGVTLF
jgi:hypothetical protein